MSKTLHNNAESFISELKQLIDHIWENYGDFSVLDSLAYATKEYGVMQRAELISIINVLASLKKHVDSLADDCQDIPMEFKVAGYPAQEALVNE